MSQVDPFLVAGQKTKCRKSIDKVSQVCIFPLTCDMKWRSMMFSVASDKKKADLRRYDM